MSKLVLVGSLLVAASAADVFEAARRVAGGPPAAQPPYAAGGGEVVLEVRLAASGVISEVRTILDGPPFTDPLREAVARWRFEPAKAAGAPVASAVLVAGVFRPPALGGGGPAVSQTPSSRPDCDEVPAPVEVVTPPYPPQGLGDHLVLAEVVVETNGQVAGVTVVEGSGVFAHAASDAARRWRFRTACHNGQPFSPRAYLVFGFSAPVIVPLIKR